MAFSLTSNMDFLKKLPMYKPFLKTVLKSQIQLLVDQLSEYGDEESLFLTASITDGTLSHIGSKSGQVFLECNEEIKAKFLEFCLAGCYDSNLSKNSDTLIPEPRRQKKVSKKRQNYTQLNIPVAKRFKLQNVEDVVESDPGVSVDASKHSDDAHKEETIANERDEQFFECETSKETVDFEAESENKGDASENEVQLSDNEHESADEPGDTFHVEDDIVIKIEPYWKEDSAEETKDTGDEFEMKHTSDKSSSNKMKTSSCSSWDSQEKAAQLNSEFLCCNDDLIWKKTKQKRRIKPFSLRTKYRIVKEVEKRIKSRKVIAKENGLPSSTLATWLKHSETIKADFESGKLDPDKKKQRFSNFYDIEKALLEWLKIVHLQAVVPKITSVNICDKANQLAKQFGYSPKTFQCTKAWVERFKTRHGLKKNFVKGDNCSGD